MATVESKWFGDEIAAEIERAAVEGMETVAADFVRTAHPKTPIYQGFLRRSTKWDSVKHHADRTLSIEMGSFDIGYAEYQERGTAKMEGKLFYQTSADQTWPKLPDRIKKSMRHPAV